MTQRPAVTVALVLDKAQGGDLVFRLPECLERVRRKTGLADELWRWKLESKNASDEKGLA